MIQEQLRQVGVRLEVIRLEPAVWLERRAAGDFDIDFSSANQDPSPSGLAYSWTCDGAGNAGHYCDRGADRLLFRAMASPVAEAGCGSEFLQRVEENAPAAFLYAQTYVFGSEPPLSRGDHSARLSPGARSGGGPHPRS